MSHSVTIPVINIKRTVHNFVLMPIAMNFSVKNAVRLTVMRM